MKRICQVLSFVVLCAWCAPNISSAATEKVYVGTVMGKVGNGVVFRQTSGAYYTALVAGAKLTRKFGTDMEFTEILVGDKVEVKGTLGDNNFVYATSLRNLSLYPHNTTISGKVGSININGSSFTILASSAVTTVNTDILTVFKKNSKASAFSDLKQGMTVKVKGVWDRSKTDVAAKEVAMTERLVNIEFTGKLVMKGPTTLTVVGANNAIYGVDITTAKLLSKNGKTIAVADLEMTQNVKVVGKHVSGSLQVVAVSVKAMTITK